MNRLSDEELDAIARGEGYYSDAPWIIPLLLMVFIGGLMVCYAMVRG